MSGAKRAALYARVSSKKQEREGTSLATQEQMQRAYCAEHGYTIDEQHVYVEVHTAEDLWQRPKLTELRAAARAHQFDVVVMHATDRFSRKQAHTYIIADELERLGIPLEFVTETFEDTAVGRFMHSAKAFAAEVEMEKLRERTMRGKRARLEKGKLLPGNRPAYGYRWNDERTKYVPDETTAPVVQRIYTLALTGTTLRGIAMQLTADKVPTPSGAAGPWLQRTVHFLLSKRAYTGASVAWTTRQVKDKATGKRHNEARPESEHVTLPADAMPALVDVATFEAVQRRLQLNKVRSPRNAANPEAALLRGGYARCGYCGNVLVARSGGQDQYRCARTADVGSRCWHSIAFSVLDTAVWQHIRATLLHPEHLQRELERMRQNDPSAADLETVEHALTAAKREQRTLIDNLGKVTGAAADIVAGKVNALETQCQQLTAEREMILARAQGWQTAVEKLGDVQAWCRAYGQSVDQMSYAERRLALDGLGVSVTVWRADHTPRYEIRARIPLRTENALFSTSCGTEETAILLRWTDQDVPSPEPIAVPAGVAA